jgi:hypothetical protein
LRRAVTLGLPTIEVITAVALIVAPTFGLAIGVALFTVLSIGVAVLTITRRGFSCGCFGDRAGEITLGLAIRNGLIALTLAVSAAFLRIQPEARPVMDKSLVAPALWALLVASTTGVLILQFLNVRSQARLWEEEPSE